MGSHLSSLGGRVPARRNGDHDDIAVVVTVAPSPPITVALWPVDTSNTFLYTRAGVIEGSYKPN
jgi:hypothetical protein